jgi:hypothetical protein
MEAIKPGMFVVCVDDENVESLVRKGQAYPVREVSHRGALVKLQGVAPSLASVRFEPVTSTPPPMELVNASNQ